VRVYIVFNIYINACAIKHDGFVTQKSDIVAYFKLSGRNQ